MHANFSVAKKLCALILSLLVIIGAIPVSYAANPTAPAGQTEGKSTPDEATEKKATEQQQNETENYPNMSVDSSVKSYEGASGMVYFDPANLKTVTVKIKPSAEILNSINNDIGKGNKQAITVALKDGLGNEYSLGKDCVYTTSNNLFTVKADLTKQFSSGLKSGSYVLAVKYKKDGNDLELFKKEFKIVEDNLKIKNVTYDGKTEPAWSSDEVNVEFRVDSEIIKSVTVDGQPVTGSNGYYSYAANTSKKLFILAYDQLGHQAKYGTKQVLIDKTAPVISDPVFVDENGQEVSSWSNKPVTVKLEIRETESGISASGVTINGEAPENVTETENGAEISFTATERKDFKISCADKVGNSADKTIDKDSILVDSEAPKAGDFTLSFEKAENEGDKVISFLTFGMYNNDDIKVTVDVDDNGLSAINPESIALYDGDKKLDKVSGKNNVFVLKAPENDGESHSFDLKVFAADEAGNEPESKFSVTSDDVKTRLPEGSISALKDLSADLYEIVISKIAPGFENDKVNVEFGEGKKVEKDGKIYVAGNGKLTVKSLEAVAGLKSLKATLNGENAKLDLTPDTTAKDKKVSSIEGELKLNELKSGDYTAVFTAESNSGVDSDITVEFTVDNDAPVFKDGKFTYSNFEGGAQKWVSTPVKISFDLEDLNDIVKLRYYNSSKVKEPKESDYTDIEHDAKHGEFEVSEYGKYTVVAEDALGNVSKLETKDEVQIDTESPEVVDEKFDFKKDWTKDDVTVSFKVKENPENNSDIKSVKINDKIDAEKKDGGYQFTADHYGYYIVEVTDNAGNSNKYTVFVDCIDQIAPVIEKVEFSKAANNKEYGIYANEALTMTLTVNNELNADKKGSDIDKIEIRENKKAVASSFEKGEDNAYTLSYVITPDKDIHSFTYYAKDKAGNEVEKELSSPDVFVEVDPSAGDAKKLYEVVSTEQSPSIQAIQKSFSSSTMKDGVPVYSGDGKFTTTITDKLAGIDSYKAYFVKTNDIEKDSDGAIKNLSSFEPVASENNISSGEKITEKKIEFFSTDKGKLKSGNYTAIVTAVNLSGNTSQKSTDLIVDNTLPTVTAVKIDTDYTEDVLCTANGIYSTKPVTIKLIYSDGAYSSGVKSFELFNGDTSLGSNETGEFTISEHNSYDLYAVVTDKNGNRREEKEALRNKEIIANGKPLVVDSENFEIICSSNEDDIKLEKTDYSFDKAKDDIYKSVDGNAAFFTMDIADSFSGIKSVTTKVLNTSGIATAVSKCEVVKDSEVKDSFNKVVSETIKQDVSNLKSGSYTLEATVTGNNGAKRVFTKNFGIDKTAPVVNSISYETEKSPADNLMNLLTFGLYSSESVKVTVTVSDNTPSSKISSDGIVLKSDTGYKVDEISESFTIIESAPGVETYQKVYYLRVDDEKGEKYDYSDLRAEVTDNFENSNTVKFYETENKAGDKTLAVDENFNIITTKKSPVVKDDFNVIGGNPYKSDNGDYWYSTGPEISFDVEPGEATLHSVKVLLNGTDVTNLCTTDGEMLPSQFTDFDNAQSSTDVKKDNNITVTLATAGEEFASALNNGKNELVVTATGNNGITSPEKKLVFHVLSKAPEVDETTIKYTKETWHNGNIDSSFTVKSDGVNIIKRIEVVREHDTDDGFDVVRATDYTETQKVKNKKYSFTADKYGKEGAYIVRVYDFVGHVTETKLKEIKIDKLEPSISVINLEPYEPEPGQTYNGMPYGTYSNGSIKMTVSVDNSADAYGGRSPLSDTAVKSTVNGEEAEFVGRTKDTDDYVFIIKPLDKINNDNLDVNFIIKDEAGNESTINLKDSSVYVNTTDELKKKYEILSTVQKPEIDDFTIDFKDAKGVSHNDGNQYTGDGTFKTEITDKASGIDRYYAYFMETSKVPADLDKLDTTKAVAHATGISDTSKIRKYDVAFNSTNTNKLKSGNYTAIVVARNINGNEFIKRKDIVVKNDPPAIIGVSITTGNGNVSDNGVYTSGNVKLKISYTEGDYNAGIESVELFNGKNSLAKNTKGNLGEFTLTEDGVYDLYALVTDKYGNCKDAAEALKNVPITVNGKTLEDNGGNFEIVINNNTDITKSNGFEYSFDYGSQNTNNIFSDIKGKGKIFAEFTNEVSGVYSISAKVDGNEVDKSHISYTQNQGEKDKYNKVTKNSATVDVYPLNLSSGKHTIIFTVTDYCGIQSTFSEDFFLDKTAPVIKSIVYKKNSSMVDQVLNVLTFGLYSNNSIDVTVNVTDKAPTSTINEDGIALSSKSGKKVEVKSFEKQNGEDPKTNDFSYSKTFILKVGENETDSFYNDLYVTVSDIFENNEKGNVVNYSNYLNKVDDKNKIEIDESYKDTDNFDIVATEKSADITMSVNEKEGTGVYDSKNTKDKTQNGFFFAKQPTVNFTVTDKVSKLHKIEVLLNNTDVTSFVSELAGTNGVFTDFDTHTGNKVEKISCSLDTAVTGLVNKDGKYSVTVNAYSNNGNKATQIIEFIYDTTNPEITRYEFVDGSGNHLYEEGMKVNTDKVNYSYFFKEGATIKVSANDNIISGVDGSGVKTIKLELTDSDTGKTTYMEESASSYEKSYIASFKLNADFRGHLKAYAVDNVNNNSNGEDKYSPDNVVAEHDSTFLSNTSAKFELPSTPYSDAKGQPLYNHKGVTVSINAWSRYAGVKQVNIYVSGDNVSEGNPFKTVNVDRAGNVTNGEATDYYYDKSKKTNIVTDIHTTITVNYDVNNIKIRVEVIDNAGFSRSDIQTTGKQIFSIDTVKPRVKVDQTSASSGNTVGGQTYFNKDVVLTITVYERNFDPKDFNLKITNTDGTIPQLSGITNWSKTIVNPSVNDNTQHVARITFHADGDYTFDCSYTDLAGHRNTELNSKKFTVDQTAPKISISYDPSSSHGTHPYYNVTRVATITIEEHNFISDSAYLRVDKSATGPDNSTPATSPSESGWTTSGNISRASITYDKDGKYSFVVNFKDKANNPAVEVKSEEFYIDKTIEEPKFENVKMKQAYNKTIAPKIVFFDYNIATPTNGLERSSLVVENNTTKYKTDNAKNLSYNVSDTSTGKTIAYNNFEDIVENDGIYTITATNRDKAGNEKSKSLIFSVNRYGSTFLIEDAKSRELLDKFYTNNCPDIVVSEVNVNALKESKISVMHDEDIRDLSKDDYKVENVSGKGNSWYECRYTIKKNNFDNEGNYTVTVASKNEFGKSVTNRNAYQNKEKKIDRTCPISFVVDKTDPNIKITGVEDGKPYSEAEKNVNIVCNDVNISPETFKVTFDNKEQKVDTSTSGIKVEGELTLRADGNDGARNLSVTVVDKAGNKTTKGVKDFRLSASWITMLFYYYWGLLAAIGGGIAALIVFLIILKKKKGNKAVQ